MGWSWRTGHVRARSAYVVDGVVALILLLVVVLELVAVPGPGAAHATPVAFVLGAGFTMPYAAHRTHPVIALALTCLSVLAYSLGHFNGYPGYALFVLVFGLALHGDRHNALFSLRSFLYFVATVVTMSVALALQPTGVVDLSTWISSMLVLAVAWLAGENLRARRDRWTQLEDRARRLEAEREDRARQAVDAERMRIARELHDVVAHSMSVIAVQAGVAHHVIDSRPQLARDALGAIETTSRSALVELRRMLGVLRQSDQPDEGAALQPCYCLDDLDDVLVPLRSSGLQVEVGVTGDTGAVPEMVSLSAYRIVQEALTNVLKHGGGSASLAITCTESEVVVSVRDHGPRTSRPPVDGSGHGLIGMRERVAVFGGTLEAGAEPGGGYHVVATLPYAEPRDDLPVTSNAPTVDPTRSALR